MTTKGKAPGAATPRALTSSENRKINMPENIRTDKHNNDNSPFHVQPTDRLNLLTAIAADRRMKDFDVKLVVYLFYRRNNKTGQCNPRHKTIASALSVSVTKVRELLSRLAEHGYTKIVERFNADGQSSNQYDLDFALGCREPSSWMTGGVGQTTGGLSARRQGGCQLGDPLGVGQPATEPGEGNTEKRTQRKEPGINPGSHSAPGMSPCFEGDHTCGADRHGKPRPYKQTKEEADQTFERLERMQWKKEAENPDFQPTPKADKSARIHWHKLLKSEIAAWRIERAAERFIAEWPENQRPCLAGFLGRYARQCIAPDEWLYIPENEQPSATNDNQQAAGRKVSGIDWENDPPF